MSNQDNRLVLAPVAADFHVNLSDQRTGRIQYAQFAVCGLILNHSRYSMGAEYDCGAVGDFLKLINEHSAFLFKVINDIAVMHHLMPHINRGTITIKCAFNYFDRTIYARAKAPGIRKFDCELTHQVAGSLAVCSFVEFTNPTRSIS